MFKRKARNNGAELLPKPLPMRKRSSIAAIDFEGTRAHVVQAAGGQVTRVSTVALDLAEEKLADAKALGAALKAALEKNKIKIKETILGLPRGLAVLRPLQTPIVADIRELASIVNFQIAKDLPFRVEDAVVDFKVLRAIEAARPGEGDAAPAPEQRLEVLVGAIKKEVLEFYRTVAREAGLKMEGLGLRSLGHAEFLRQAHAAPPEGAALLLALRTDESAIEVIDRGKLVFSRVAGVPLPPPDEDPAAFLQSMQIEVVRSLHSHAGSGEQQAVSKVLVCGETGWEQRMADLLGAKLKVATEVPNAAESNATAARGLALAALGPGGLTLDFENPKKPAVPRNTRRTTILLAAAAALVLLITLFAVRTHLVKKRMAVKLKVQTELAQAEKNSKVYSRLRLQHRAVTNWMAEEKSWLNHFAYLSSILPGADEIYVSAFATTPQHVIRFSVQSKTGELLAELDKKLRAAGYEVKPLSITPANDKFGYNFRTTVELTIPKKLAPDTSKAKAPPRPSDDSPPTRADAAPAKAGGARS
jgi:Tfp pilus assembly PilM family ATPase